MFRGDFNFYFFIFILSAALSFILSPIFRMIALRLSILDHPSSSVKTHTLATPYLGGCAIALSFIVSFLIAKNLFPYGAEILKPAQGIFYGGILMLMLGLIDDVMPSGLSVKEKFLIQFIGAIILILNGIQINFIQPKWLSLFLSFLWIIGIINAINIIDIMDGLAGGTAFIASAAFLFISLPTEHVYVNLAATLLAGACLGFLPFNLSKKRKIFMGDTGSLFIGFVLAALSLGTSYTTLHNAGVLAPILILGIPIYDTFFVMLLRLRKGLSPFKGSKDHFALRLEKVGFTRPQIMWIAIGATSLLSLCAWATTRIWFWWAILLYALILIVASLASYFLAKVKID